MSASDDSSFDETIVPAGADQKSRSAAGLKFTKDDSEELKLEEYSVGEELGRGGMGSVLTARHGKLERNVAVKVMLGRSDVGDPARIRFEREARILARLEHPNIVPIHDAGVSGDGRPYYSMKLVRGRTLQSIITGIRNDEAEVIQVYQLAELLTIFRKVCDAVAFAHHSGIVHRDLKPENVMVGEFGEVLVMDWGLAKIIGEPEPERDPAASAEGFGQLATPDSSAMTLDGQILGTPQYMAPEQAKGEVSKIDARTDVYALGGILQAILTLEAPVSGSSLKEMISRIESGDRNQLVAGKHDFAKHCPMNRIPPGLTAVIGRAMSVESERRYASAEELGKEVDAFQGGFNTAAEQASRFRRFTLFLQRNRFMVLACTLGLAGCAYTYLFSLLYLRTEQARLRDEINEYRRAKNDFNSLRWRTMKGLRRPPPQTKGDEWRDLWQEFMSQTNNADVKPWIMGKRSLGTPPGNPAILTLPELPLTNGWSLRMTVRKIFRSGALVVLFPSGEWHGTFNIDARRDPDCMTGLEPAEGTQPAERQFVKGPHIRPSDDWHAVEVTHRPLDDGGFKFVAKIDDQELIDWSGHPEQLMQNRFWKPEDQTRLHLACFGGNWIIEELAFRPREPASIF